MSNRGKYLLNFVFYYDIIMLVLLQMWNMIISFSQSVSMWNAHSRILLNCKLSTTVNIISIYLYFSIQLWSSGS
jgi:hypothetical protein